MGSVIVKTDNGYRVYCKGAPDMLFERLVSMVNQDGSVVDVNEEGAFSDPSINNGAAMSGLETLEWTVKQFARQALRTILVTYKDMSEDEY